MDDLFKRIITHPSPIQEQWLSTEVAVREVIAFEKRFGEKHILLACYAALSFLLTPELLNLIHLNFLDHEQIPWFAEADFLLSPFCRQLDDTLYEVEPRVREVLLAQLERQFGPLRLVEVADFLLAYLNERQGLPHSVANTTLRWIALSYRAPDEAVIEMTTFLRESLSLEYQRNTDLLGQILVATTMEIVAEPLERTARRQEYRALICDSRILAELHYGTREHTKQDTMQQSIVYNEQVVDLLSPKMQYWLLHNYVSQMTKENILNEQQNTEQSISPLATSSENSVDALDADADTTDIAIISKELQKSQQDPIMDGDLRTLGLQSILKMLALSEKTGKLFVSSGPEALSISLRKGQIVGLHEDGVPQSDLLGMLCLINKLDPPRAQIIRDMAQGDIQLALAMLVERGWMTANEMQHRLEFAVIQSVSYAMRWAFGRFAFYRQLVPINSKMQPLDVDSVLLEASRQADEWEEIVAEGITHLTRTTVARWQPEVSKDVASLGLGREFIEVLCLSNGELPLQAISLVLMTYEARIARIFRRLLELRLIEVVDSVSEKELRGDLSNVIIKCQHVLAQQLQSSNPEQHLLRLVTTLSECINGLLIHHGKYARSLRGRGHIPPVEIVRYLERRFGQSLQLLAQQFPILETTNFAYGQLDCNDILTLNKLVKGEQLEEFYWEAVQGLAAFLRMVFADLLRDEVSNSHTGRQLNVDWKVFLSEVDHEVQQYQVYRAQRTTQKAHGREMSQSSIFGLIQNWNGASNGNTSLWPSEARRKSRGISSTVLIAVNNQAMRQTIQIILQKKGIKIITISDGLSVPTAVADKFPTLIILSSILPRMNGYDICKILHRQLQFRRIPIIIVGAKGGILDKWQARRAGATEYLAKPVTPEMLLLIIKKYIDI